MSWPSPARTCSHSRTRTGSDAIRWESCSRCTTSSRTSTCSATSWWRCWGHPHAAHTHANGPRSSSTRSGSAAWGTAGPRSSPAGERQRVALARALANGPKILLADEPTGSLDSQSKARVLALMERLRSDEQVTVVVVTHDEATAEAADRVIRLFDGRVLDHA
ncbi:MAG: ATP-binding cassette domain-containing protein [Microthrixaceae bacterium]|nr:ATP-binding cassette domain-containing protein [Microthrixaceae bacterium]